MGKEARNTEGKESKDRLCAEFCVLKPELNAFEARYICDGENEVEHLADDGRPCCARHAPMEAKHEPGIKSDVCDAAGYVAEHCVAGTALSADYAAYGHADAYKGNADKCDPCILDRIFKGLR